MAYTTTVQDITDTTAIIVFDMGEAAASDTSIIANVTQNSATVFSQTVTIVAGEQSVSVLATGLTPSTASEAFGIVNSEPVFPSARFVTKAAGYTEPRSATQGQWEDLAARVKAKSDVNITMTTTDPGEGSTLAENNYIGVYGGDPIIMDYSTSEVNTGMKWIDGSAIYKKTIDCGYLSSSNTQKNIPHGITFDRLIKIECVSQDSNGVCFPIPYENAAPASGIRLAVTSTNVEIQSGGADRTSQYAYATLYYTKSS